MEISVAPMAETRYTIHKDNIVPSVWKARVNKERGYLYGIF